MDRFSLAPVGFVVIGVVLGVAAARWVPPVGLTIQQPAGQMEVRLGVKLLEIQQKQDATWTAVRLMGLELERQGDAQAAHRAWMEGTYNWGKGVDEKMWELRERQAVLGVAPGGVKGRNRRGRFEMIDSQR